ncbi:ras-like protein family member 12 isoform X4 [Motacilla alba alba]|uniref:ras-like protein family member 12 isoform X4 n=1 Tax=Motacilla alba alba TaxID=1094192 RepID=UPI0018D56CA6|nr:ras-like protein family member 12 isoform X4 [Motacilla alba alba]
MSSMFGKPRASSERPPQSPLPECNVAILGCRGAGKSALTVKFLTKRFISEYDPNLEDTYSSEELVDQQPVLLKVMDTADQDGPGNCERYLCWASAFLVVYSIDNRKSFEGCQRYLEVLALHARGCQRRCPVLLLGNKLDMEQYREGTTRTHRVKQQGQPTSEGTNPGEGHSHQFTPCSWNTPAACGQTPPGELCQVSALKCLSTHSCGIHTWRAPSS